jgi:hypothetical protein
MRTLFLSLTAVLSAVAAEFRPSLIPYPQECKWTGETVPTSSVKPNIVITEGSVTAPIGVEEAYVLEITRDKVTIKANTRVGSLRALATLQQLTESGKLPIGAIRDWPAFPIRGVLQDVGRNFQSITALKQQILVMEMFKLNVFHWHLTDYPGWRVESKINAGLNDPKSRSRKPNSQYSWEEIRDFIAFAEVHGVEVIPEMDMPGHSTYFTKGLGFDMQTPQGLKVLEAEIVDWAKLFPSKLFHTGSDEVQIKMKEFVPTILAKTKAVGKTPIIWSPGAVVRDSSVVLQLWAKAGLPKSNPYIDSRYVYVNHMDPSEAANQSFIQIGGLPRTDGRALGAILCNWPDHVIDDETNANRVSPTWPVAAAFAESAWRGVPKDIKSYYARTPETNSALRQDYLDLERRIVSQRNAVVATGEPFPFVTSAHIPWSIVSTAPGAPEPTDWSGASTAWGGTIYLNHHWHELPSWLPLTKNPAVAWARTYVHSNSARTVGLSIGFDVPSASDGHKPELASIAGQWDVAGSAIWVNGKAVAPPKWTYAGLSAKEVAEKPWVDHAWWMRAPETVQLKAGWNEIRLRTPSHLKDQKLRKWMFTAIPTQWDAKTRTLSEVEGLRFSTKPE